MRTFYLTALLAAVIAGHGSASVSADVDEPQSVANAESDDPDALYARRDDLASARRSAHIWANRLAKNPKEFESAWKLARARFWLGGHAPEAERKQLLEQGIEAARVAIAAMPSRPEGHFWLAANMGTLA
jgi:hypothetical protein